MIQIHLVASGYDKSFCGLEIKDIQFTSLGMACNCQKCLDVAQDILNKQLSSTKTKVQKVNKK